MSEPAQGSRPDEGRIYAITLLGAVVVFLSAVGLAVAFDVDMKAFSGGDPARTAGSFLIGVAATAPLVVLLLAFSSSDLPALRKFRDSQIEFLAQIGFRLTPLRITMIGIAAGLSEEALFRGVLQTVLDRHAPLVVAVVGTNVLFGALHARTLLYAMIAGLVGIYLGVLFSWRGDLIAPITTHALYDVAALALADRMIRARYSQ